MEKILITGGAGFIGSNLVDRLVRMGKYEIYVLDKKKNPNNLRDVIKDIHYIRGDLRDKKLVDNILKSIPFVGVIHFAAVSRVIWGEKNPEECVSTNVDGTKTLLDSISKSGYTPWFIFGSSREVYGEQTKFPVREDAPKRPINVYGKAKLKGEKSVIKHSEKYHMNSIILRFSNVYGNDKDILDRVIPKFILNALKNESLEIHGGTQIFDFTYIDDTVEGIILAMNLLEKSRIMGVEDFHILPGSPVKITDLPKLISEHVGYPVDTKFTSPREYDVNKFYGDPTKAKDILGFVAKVDIREGIKRTTKRFEEVFL